MNCSSLNELQIFLIVNAYTYLMVTYKKFSLEEDIVKTMDK